MLKSIYGLVYPLKVEVFAAQMPCVRDKVGHLVLQPSPIVGDPRYKDDVKVLLDAMVDAFNRRTGTVKEVTVVEFSGDGVEAKVEVQPEKPKEEKKGRGRPKKK